MPNSPIIAGRKLQPGPGCDCCHGYHAKGCRVAPPYESSRYILAAITVLKLRAKILAAPEYFRACARRHTKAFSRGHHAEVLIHRPPIIISKSTAQHAYLQPTRPKQGYREIELHVILVGVMGTIYKDHANLWQTSIWIAIKIAYKQPPCKKHAAECWSREQWGHPPLSTALSWKTTPPPS